MVHTAPNRITGQQAGFASRLCAFSLDLVLINFALILATAAAGVVLRYFNFDNLFNIGEEPTTLGRVIVSVISAVGFLICYFVYPIFFWVTIGQTPGKLLFGLRVIRTDGQRLGVGKAFLRCIGYWISAIVFALGFLWI